MYRRRLFAMLATTLLASGCTSLPSTGPVKVRDGALVDLDQRSLYVFDRDSRPNRSTCYGSCARDWPPLLAEAEADTVPVGHWHITKRDDALWQWTYKGRPVYRHAGDLKPGDRRGDGADGLWHVVRP